MLAQKQHIVLCAVLSVVLTAFHVHAARVSLSWTAPTTNQDSTPLTDLAGYKVYHGFASRSYNVTIDVGLTTSAVLSDLQDGRTYYFAVTAYDTSGNQSVFTEVRVHHSARRHWTVPMRDQRSSRVPRPTDVLDVAAGYEAAHHRYGRGDRAGIAPMGNAGAGWRWTSAARYLRYHRAQGGQHPLTDTACRTGMGAPGAIFCQATASKPRNRIPLPP